MRERSGLAENNPNLLYAGPEWIHLSMALTLMRDTDHRSFSEAPP